MYTQTQLLDFLKTNKPHLQKQYGIEKIGLFGSYAKGTQTPQSDLDIILEFRDGTDDLLEKRLSLEAFFAAQLGLKVDIARERFIRPSIKKQVLAHAIFI